jgi:hypothetical protein
MNHTRLLIPTDRLKRRTKTIAKPSRRSFSLGLDELTHLTLVELQKTLSGPTLNPSRTLITREAILRYGQEARARIANGDRDWIAGEVTAIAHLARTGSK